eukprot:g5127.t1
MSENIGTRPANASDVGLIVQGTLIFLSACVAIVGYWVQGQLRAKERRREIDIARSEKLHQARLATVRKKITEFVGPAHFMLLTLNMTFFDLRTRGLAKFYKEEAEIQAKRIKEEDIGFGSFMKGKWNEMTAERFFGTEMMNKLKQEKDGPAACHFRKIVSRCFRKLLIPIAEMIKQNAGYLQEWESKEKFSELYPVAKGKGMERNRFLVQFVQFSIEMEAVVEDWDEGKNLDVFWTTQCPYPFQAGMYMIRMMTKLREMENEEGLASHVIADDFKNEKDKARLIKEVDGVGSGLRGRGKGAGEAGGKSSKYTTKIDMQKYT